MKKKVTQNAETSDPYKRTFKKLSNRTMIQCPCLKTTVMIGMCNLMCKHYKINRYGEQCGYIP
jgi:hypothetical protein